MLKALLLGVASGYILKLMQIVCNLVLIPFLISNKVLGLAGYGQLSAVLATIGLLTALYDGWRLSCARRLGIAEKVGEAVYMPLLVMTLVPIILLGLCAFFYGDYILVWLGFGDDFQNLALIIVVYFLFEQVNFLSEQCFHAKGKTWIVNSVLLLEVFCRTLTIYVLFTVWQPSIELYLKIFVAYMIIKYIVYGLWLITRRSAIGVDTLGFSIYREMGTFYYSLPLSVKGLSIFSVFRLSVVVVNKYLSSELAAIYSILMVTLRNYITQLFVSVLRPMIVPLSAGIGLSQFSNQSQLRSLLKNYELFVCTISLFVALLVPYWLSAWLQQDLSAYYFLYISGVAFFGLESSSSIKNFLLVSQGYAKILTLFALILSLVHVSYLSCIFLLHDMLAIQWVIMGVICFILLYAGISVPYLFSKKIVKEYDRRVFILPVIYTVIVLLSLFSLQWLRYKQLPEELITIYGLAFFIVYLFVIYNPFLDKQLYRKLLPIFSR